MNVPIDLQEFFRQARQQMWQDMTPKERAAFLKSFPWSNAWQGWHRKNAWQGFPRKKWKRSLASSGIGSVNGCLELNGL
jgi:hypothetical protein